LDTDREVKSFFKEFLQYESVQELAVRQR